MILLVNISLNQFIKLLNNIDKTLSTNIADKFANKILKAFNFKAFSNLEKFIKVNTEYTTKEANRFDALVKYFNVLNNNIAKQISSEIDLIYSETNYLKAIATNTAKIAEFTTYLKPYVQNMVARGINPLGGGFGINIEPISVDSIRQEPSNIKQLLKFAKYQMALENQFISYINKTLDTINLTREIFI